jgi:hypothetical protein
MGRTRQRQVRTFFARTPSGQRVLVEEWVTEHDATTLSDTHTQWIQGSKRYESDRGPVNKIDGVYTLAVDGSVLTPE